MNKNLLILMVAVMGLALVGCSGGGSNDSADQPKVTGKVDQVDPPGGENVDDSLKRAQQQRDNQAAQNKGQDDTNMSESGN